MVSPRSYFVPPFSLLTTRLSCFVAPMGGKREQDIRLKLEMDPPSDVQVTEKGGSTSEKLFRFVGFAFRGRVAIP